ncbi:MAG TPA: hypothetical protein DCE78_10425 [Bacteroidetes bacterium]|nr:hypothetical protein [Bacteroidota bacterium]
MSQIISKSIQDSTTTSMALVDVIENEFVIREPSDMILNEFDDKKIRINLDLNFKKSDQSDLLIVFFSVKYDYKYDDINFEFLRCIISYHFRIAELEKFIKISDKGIDINESIALNLVSIVVSTTRGIIATKSKGYFINKFYLPILNARMIAEQFSIESK